MAKLKKKVKKKLIRFSFLFILLLIIVGSGLYYNKLSIEYDRGGC